MVRQEYCIFASENKIADRIMCTISINIDEASIRKMRPDLNSTSAISQWAQQLIDARIRQMTLKDTGAIYDAIERGVKECHKAEMMSAQENAIDVETMRERLHRMVHEVYSMS